jgi:predicted P-loop ATPase
LPAAGAAVGRFRVGLLLKDLDLTALYPDSQIPVLSRQVDGPVRLAYQRTSTEVPRQFVAIGTTNRVTEYLKDSTGNRRFWPVKVRAFDPA